MWGLRPSEDEFTELVAAKAHGLRRTAYLMCGDWHLAEDHVQTSFIKVYRAWHRVRDREGLDGYLRTTLLRTCIDYQRKSGREVPSAEVPEYASVPEGAVGDREILVAALRRIAPGQRAVLVLRFFEDLSVEETAGVLGVSAGTVKSQTAKGLDAMRNRVLSDFARSAGEEPHWSPDAAALARIGEREARRRKVLTVVGAFVAAVALAAGSIAAWGHRPKDPQPIQPVPSVKPTNASDVLKYWRFDMGDEFLADSPYPAPTAGPTGDIGLERRHVTTPEAWTLLAVAQHLDPDLTHLHAAPGAGPELKVSDGPQMSGRLYAKAVTLWTPHQHETAFDPTRGVNVIAVTMQQAPPSGQPDPEIVGAPCGMNIGMLDPRNNKLNWSRCEKPFPNALPDGSIIETTQAPDGPGIATAALRVFPDHSLIGIVAIDFAVYESGAPTPNSWQFVENGTSTAGPVTPESAFDVTALANALVDPAVTEFR